MTYAELLNALYQLPKDRLEDTVTVYNADDDSFCEVITSGIAIADKNDVLDPGHFYLALRSANPYEL